jgi:uncharacterized membrane protein
VPPSGGGGAGTTDPGAGGPCRPRANRLAAGRPVAAYDLDVSDFLRTLHVLAAVLLIGPLVAAPFLAWWAIRRRNADAVRFAANLTAALGGGALVVAGLGLGTLLTGDEWTLATPWVLISATLFVVALALIWGYAVPGLRRAANLVMEVPAAVVAPAGSGVAEVAAEETTPSPEAPAALAEEPAGGSGDDLRRRHRLDSITARITGTGWLLLVVFGAITVLMAWRPFG